MADTLLSEMEALFRELRAFVRSQSSLRAEAGRTTAYEKVVSASGLYSGQNTTDMALGYNPVSRKHYFICDLDLSDDDRREVAP